MTYLRVLANIYIEDKTPTGNKRDEFLWAKAMPMGYLRQEHRTNLIRANRELLHVISQMQNMTNPIPSTVDKLKQ